MQILSFVLDFFRRSSPSTDLSTLDVAAPFDAFMSLDDCSPNGDFMETLAMSWGLPYSPEVAAIELPVPDRTVITSRFELA